MQPDSLDIHKQLTTARLPALPQVLLQLLELCDRDDVGIAEIGVVVAKDAAIAARVVMIANSPYYHPGRNLESIDQCLSILGTSTVRKLAMNQSVVELFDRFQRNGAYDLRHFWFHGLSVAVSARELAKRLGYANHEEAYLAGLLRDVGQLALLTVAADRYLPMFANFTGEQAMMRQEQASFGLTHAEVGAWLAERWNLRSLLVDSILYHHEPLARVREAHLLVQIVMLANLFSGLAHDQEQIDAVDLAHWGMSIEEARALAEAAQHEAREIAAQLGVELPGVPQAEITTVASDDLAPMQLAKVVAQRLDVMTTPGHVSEAQNEDADAALADLQRSASLLFGARAVTVLPLQADTLEWRGTDGQILLSIDARHSGSILAAACHGSIGLIGAPGAKETLVDRQVLHGLEGERLLCLPLKSGRQGHGVLAIALSADAAAWFMARPALLRTFAHEAGNRLGEAMSRKQHQEATRNEQIKQHELQVRKLVHEAATPLSVVRNYLCLLRDQLAAGDSTRQDIALMESELRRVGRLLREFRPSAASAGSVNAHGPVDVNAVIRDVARVGRLGRVALQKVEIVLELADELPKLNSDGDKLRQILGNLIFNAAEAMPNGGRIVIGSTAWRSVGGNDSIELNVSDNGPGIPKVILDQLYQPVQTSKGDAHAGLGLSILGTLVAELGGNIQCSSSSAGTRFKLMFHLTS